MKARADSPDPVGGMHRRTFLAGLAGAPAGLRLPGLLAGLGTAARASAQAADDYRALICINLLGGLDHLQAVVPFDAVNHAALAALRPGTLPSRSQLAATALQPATAQGSRQVALHPKLADMARQFALGELAVLHGSGQLDRPVTRAGLESGADSLPRASGSHNDGQSFATSLGPEGTFEGWGGLLADRLAARNPDHRFASINLGWPTPFGVGGITRAIGVDPSGVALPVAGTSGSLFGSTVASAEHVALIARTDGSPLERDYRAMLRLVQESAVGLGAALSATQNLLPIPTDPSLSDYSEAWRGNPALPAARTAMRLISRRADLGVRRQVFILSLPGFDTHGDSVGNLDQRLLPRINALFRYLRDGLTTLGVFDRVTCFTTSEFGRSLRTNSNAGTDHGWGGVQFVLGGGVRGGDVYGRIPVIGVDSADFHVAGGGPIAIPTLSHEQVGATLGRWLGVTDADASVVFPNLPRFASSDLGFMRAG